MNSEKNGALLFFVCKGQVFYFPTIAQPMRNKLRLDGWSGICYTWWLEMNMTFRSNTT